ncbi:hypothetical protein GW17_00033994, partial [Ensete ventricosum]
TASLHFAFGAPPHTLFHRGALIKLSHLHAVLSNLEILLVLDTDSGVFVFLFRPSRVSEVVISSLQVMLRSELIHCVLCWCGPVAGGVTTCGRSLQNARTSASSGARRPRTRSHACSSARSAAPRACACRLAPTAASRRAPATTTGRRRKVAPSVPSFE